MIDSSRKYKHLFFDLDRTLWNFDRNSTEAILELFEYHQLDGKLQVGFDDFLKLYKIKNDELWVQYRNGKVQKDELRQQRFYRSFMAFGYDNAPLALQFNNDYVMASSSKKNLLEGANEMLDYLSKDYHLHIITNGFQEAQYRKLENCNIRNYFDAVVVSDGLGFKKPDQRIFHHAMKMANAKNANSLMIGDDYASDILGAKNVGIDQVYIDIERNNNKEATYTISKLIELKDIL